MGAKDTEVGDLQKGGEIQVMDSDKGSGGTRYENPSLIDGIICWIKRTIVLKWTRR